MIKKDAGSDVPGCLTVTMYMDGTLETQVTGHLKQVEKSSEVLLGKSRQRIFSSSASN